MRLRELRLANLRAFADLGIELDPGWNLFTGANGAGKTTLLEAVYLLSHARSFRGGSKTCSFAAAPTVTAYSGA